MTRRASSTARARRRRAQRRGLLLLAAVLVCGGLAVMVAFAGNGRGGSAAGPDGAAGGTRGGAPAAGQTALGPLPLSVDLSGRDTVRVPFHQPPTAGLLVNLDTGQVLWRRNPTRSLPMASLTKMMTALVVVDALRPDDKARITNAVLAYSGSGVGVLPKNKRVKVETLLYGLMLPSGNDAARALAFRTAGSIHAFVRLMNQKAGAMGLRCTHYVGVEGLSPGNRSCPVDLAVLARRILDTPRLAKIVGTRQKILPFPIKGGRIELYNNNPLLRSGYPGILGVKTGYTDRAGMCLVAVARRKGVRLAAIVMHSPNWGDQSRKLLDAGFRTIH